MLKMVVFDMAGTTVDEDNVVYKSLQSVIQGAGYPCSLEEVLTQGAGKEKRQAIRDIIQVRNKGATSETELDDLYDHFMQTLEQAYADLNVKPQPGAESIFQALKARGIPTVLNTGYQRSTAEYLVEKLGWKAGKDFDALITASDVANGRPAPDMIRLAQEKSGIESALNIAKVGDATVDIEEGRNAGCGWTIGVTTGAHNETQLREAGPDFVIGSLDELEGILGL